MRFFSVFMLALGLLSPLNLFAESNAAHTPKENSNFSFSLYGDLNTYYKVQDNYLTPLDSNLSSERNGANNRSTQNTRTRSVLTFLGKSGKQYSDKNSEFIAVFQLGVDADDPDHTDNTNSDTDWERRTAVDNKELWIRYSPIEAVGIKIGSQTIKATSTAAEVYRYKGDFDDDFVFYAASTLSEKPGVSIDFHPSKAFEIGFAQIEGMGDGSRIASRGNTSEAKNTVLWGKGTLGIFDFGVAQQTIKVGSTSTDADPAITHWAHQYKHTMSNVYVKARLGAFTPYVGYQTIDGDDTDGSKIEASFSTIGLLATVGDGQLAVDFTKIDTPKFGDEGAIKSVVEVDHVLHLNYNYQVSDEASISFFYNAMTSKDDSVREASEQSANATVKAVAQACEWSDTTSYGLQLQVKFKGL